MYNILLAEKDSEICNTARRYIESDGHCLFETTSGTTASDMGCKNKYDLIILNTDLDGEDGITVCEKIRKIRLTPVIFISERTDIETKLAAFSAGADDYLTIPFIFEEFTARIYAVLFRSSGSKFINKPDRYESDGLVIDMSGRRVFIDGVIADMSPKEYNLLFYLVKNRGKAIKREDLLTEVWGFDFFGGERTLDTHIKLLRHSLGRYSDRIVTLRGVGFRFDDKK